MPWTRSSAESSPRWLQLETELRICRYSGVSWGAETAALCIPRLTEAYRAHPWDNRVDFWWGSERVVLSIRFFFCPRFLFQPRNIPIIFFDSMYKSNEVYGPCNVFNPYEETKSSSNQKKLLISKAQNKN